MLWEKGLVPFTEGRVLPSRSPRLPRREMLPVCVQSWGKSKSFADLGLLDSEAPKPSRGVCRNPRYATTRQPLLSCSHKRGSWARRAGQFFPTLTLPLLAATDWSPLGSLELQRLSLYQDLTLFLPLAFSSLG